LLQDSTSQIVLLSEVNDEKFNALFCCNEFNALITLQGRHIVGLVTVEQYIVNNWNQQNLHIQRSSSEVTSQCVVIETQFVTTRVYQWNRLQQLQRCRSFH